VTIIKSQPTTTTTLKRPTLNNHWKWLTVTTIAHIRTKSPGLNIRTRENTYQKKAAKKSFWARARW